MASNNIIGLIPVYVLGATPGVLNLLYIRADTVFFNIVSAEMPAATAPPVEEQVQEDIDQEVQEAGDAFFAELAEKDMTEAAHDWEAEHDKKEEEGLAHVVQLLEEADKEELPRVAEPSEEEKAKESKKTELRELFRQLNRLNLTQQPLYEAVKEMQQVKDPKKRANNTTKYWDTWNRLVATQKDWLSTLEALKALDAELEKIDPDYEFNALANSWHPDGPGRDYWALYAKISRNFNGNISRDQELRARIHKPAAAEERAPATLDQLIMPHIRGGNSA